MQGLVYIFIALAALGVAGAAYFGLTFTPIEAAVTALVFGGLAVVLMERKLRQRSEARIEKAIEDLSRLLSTDAQAGSTLSQRVNALTDENAGRRLDALEADVSVLGTVVRQLAESVAEIEEQRRKGAPHPHSAMALEPADDEEDDAFPEPVIPLEMLRQAIDDNRLICHLEPIIGLPQRKPHGYDLVPRLMLEDGELADPPDFMPRHGGEELTRRIEWVALTEAVVIARRAKTGGAPIMLYVPVSRATLGSAPAMEQVFATLDANRAIAQNLTFALAEGDWRALPASERSAMGGIAKRGVSFSMVGATTLRYDFGDMQGLGFRSVRVDATKFLGRPEQFTDFHTGDVADYLKRYAIDLIGAGVVGEQQLLTLFEDGIALAQGPHIGGPGPVRQDLLVERALAGLAAGGGATRR